MPIYTWYECPRCRRHISRDTRECPYCKVLLAGIRCNHCGFVGGSADFSLDRCPKCGSSTGAAPPDEPIDFTVESWVALARTAAIDGFVTALWLTGMVLVHAAEYRLLISRFAAGMLIVSVIAGRSILREGAAHAGVTMAVGGWGAAGVVLLVAGLVAEGPVDFAIGLVLLTASGLTFCCDRWGGTRTGTRGQGRPAGKSDP